MMMQTIRERTPELAVLKSLGFSDRAVFVMVLAEALVTCVAAALIGLALAMGVFPYAAKFVAGLSMPMIVIVRRDRSRFRRVDQRGDPRAESGAAPGRRCAGREIGMNIARQFSALLGMSFSGIPARLGLVSTIIVGVACAVGVLVSMLAMGVGARREALGNVRPDRVILLQAQAPSPFQSNIPKDQAAAVACVARHPAQREGRAHRGADGDRLRAGSQPAGPLAHRLSHRRRDEGVHGLLSGAAPHVGPHVPARPSRAHRQ